jgi:hypothetical protein
MHREAYREEGVNILTGARPGGYLGRAEAANSWCVALKVNAPDKAIAREVDALVASRLKWRDDVATRRAPVRCTEGSQNTLHVFALTDCAEPFRISRSQRFYRSPKDASRYHKV